MTSRRSFHACSLAVTCTALLTVSCSSDGEGDTNGPSRTGDGGPRLHDPNCQPKPGADVPDEVGDDSNCDGIDGDLLKAVFVSPGGIDTASGEPTAPVKTLTRAVALAQTSARDVYVCSGTYPENVVIEQRGVHIYGGFDCSRDWARTGTHALIAPASGKPLRVVGATDVLIQGVDFRAPDGVKPGESSVAATVIDSQQVRIEQVVLQAGSGAPGKPGEAAAPAVATPPQKATDGGSAPAGLSCSLSSFSPACNDQIAGGLSAARSYACETPAREYLGGWGGKGEHALDVAAGQTSPNTDGAVGVPASTVVRRIPPRIGDVTPGRHGLAGAVGKHGTAAASGFGSLVSGEYIPSNSGGDGQPGGVGQAGDGGDGGHAFVDAGQGTLYHGGGGGQGGFPGCGGAAGRGGGGGGASIGLVIVNSKVTLQSVTFITGVGGVGGPPSGGSAGQPGGEPGAGGKGMPTIGVTVDTNGAAGGRGGAGGPGGNGGPGAGGPSVGIVLVGEDPALFRVTYQIGEGGSGARSIDTLSESAKGMAATMHRVP